jgi:prephenate dehydratase
MALPIEMARVAVMGQPGAYHDQVAGHLFGDTYQPLHTGSFAEVFEAVEGKQVDYGVTAVENSSVGDIPAAYELLRKHAGGIATIGEAYLDIHHSLLGVPGSSVEGIGRVVSHPVALAQCRNFLNSEIPAAQTENANDTASAAAHVAEAGDPSVAAIAGAENADRYGLTVIRDGIEDDPTNQTRFLVLQHADHTAGYDRNSTKASLLVTGLFEKSQGRNPRMPQVLGSLAYKGTPITKFREQPAPGRPWSPDVFLDIRVNPDGPGLSAIQTILRATGLKVQLLGMYPEGQVFDGPPIRA